MQLRRNSHIPGYLRSVDRAIDWALALDSEFKHKFGLAWDLPESVRDYDALIRFYEDEFYVGREEDEGNNTLYDTDVARVILTRTEFYVELMNDYWNSDYVELYRALSVENISDIDFGRVGRFWAYSKSCARAHMGIPTFRTMVLTGQIKPQHIDWEGGFLLYLDYGDEECEVRVDDRAPVLITAIDEMSVEIEGTI